MDINPDSIFLNILYFYTIVSKKKIYKQIKKTDL